MLHTLDHVILAVGDLEAATRAYALLLGRRPSWRGEHPSAGSANTLFRLRNTYLELLSPSGPGPIGDVLRGVLAAQGDGPLGLVFGTSDASACRDELDARGLEPGPVEKGLGRDVESGAIREWLRVPLPFARTRGILIFAIQHLSPAELLPPRRRGLRRIGRDLGPRSRGGRDLRARGGEGLLRRRPGAPPRARPRVPAVGRPPDLLPGRRHHGRAGRAPGRAPVTPGRDRFFGLSWRVPDADAARARLAAAGIDASEVRPGRKPGTRVLSVRSGSCGVPTLLIEPRDAEA